MPTHARDVERLALPDKRVWMITTEPAVEIQTEWGLSPVQYLAAGGERLSLSTELEI